MYVEAKHNDVTTHYNTNNLWDRHSCFTHPWNPEQYRNLHGHTWPNADTNKALDNCRHLRHDFRHLRHDQKPCCISGHLLWVDMDSIYTFGCSGRSGLTMWRTKRSDFELGWSCLGLYFSGYTSQSDLGLLLLLDIWHLNCLKTPEQTITIPASSVHTQKHFYTLCDCRHPWHGVTTNRSCC